MLGVVIQIDGFDPVLAQAVTLRASSHDDPAVCHAGGGEPWWPALIKLPTLRYDLFDGAFGGEITAPSSSLTLAAEPWPNLARYALADARLRLWTGVVGAPWDNWTLRFDGRITEQPELADGTASINFAVDDRWLDAALLSTYAGTSGPEGTEALKGQPKPLALGAPRYVSGTLIDSINTVFQLSAYGPLRNFEAALERLARFGSSVGDFASYAALVAAQVPAGQWATAKAVGMVRLGAPTTGQVSFLIGGDQGGPDGWARLPGAIIRRLALLSGGAGRINDASLNALDVARPYNQSIYVDQQSTARQLIQQIAASVNAVAGMSWTGQLFVVPVGIGATTISLAADGSALPPVTSVKQIGIAAPFRKLAIGAARAWTVHALSDIAFTAPLVDVGRYDAGKTYREGNIVDLEDGSRWLYVATVPAAGNAPAGESTYWSSLSGPVRAAYDDGTPIEDLKPAQPGADVTGNNTSKDTASVGGRPANQVVADADKAKADIDGLVATFGSTASAATSANAARDAEANATTARDAAQGARDAAQEARALAGSSASTAIAAKTDAQVASTASAAARDAAATARDLAQGYSVQAADNSTYAFQALSAAQSARDAAIQKASDAATSATSAGGSATTASGQATIATQKADAAGQSASTASAKADIATTKAGEASVSSSNAAISEANALGSKTAATAAQAVVASTAASVNLQRAMLLPDRYDASGADTFGLVMNNAGVIVPPAAPTALVSQAANAVAPGFGPVFQVVYNQPVGSLQNNIEWNARGVLPAVPGRIYKFEGEFQLISVTGAADSFAQIVLRANALDVDYKVLPSPSIQSAPLSGSVQTVSILVSDVADPARGILAWPAGTVWLRPSMRLRSGQSASSITIQARRLTPTDVTQAMASAASALASATSASSAAASKSGADQSASASQTSATAAQTARGQAETFANSASSSRDSAAGSASTAMTQAGVSATAAKKAAIVTFAEVDAQALAYTGNYEGSPDTVSNYPDGKATYANGRWGIDGGSSGFVLTKAVLPVPTISGTVYEIEADIDLVYATGTVFAAVGMLSLTGAYGYQAEAPRHSDPYTASGIRTVRARYSDVASPGVSAWPVGGRYLRPGAMWQQDVAGNSGRVLAIRVRDVTAEVNATKQASAAAGSASTASASQTAAAQSAAAAQSSATTASTKAGEATTSASQASASETNALGSKSAAASSANVAATARDDALAAKNNASNSATAAATSESNAAASKTAAGSSATAAKSSETSAGTSAGTATTKASEAATSAANASGSANSASASQLVAASSATQAVKTVGSSLPSDFSQGATFWRGGFQGPYEDPVNGWGWTFTTDPVEGGIATFAFAGSRDLSHRGLAPNVEGRKYRATVRIKSSGGPTTCSFYAYIIRLNSDTATAVETPNIMGFGVPTTYTSFTVDFDGVAASRGAYHRLLVRPFTDGSVQTFSISRIDIEDITESARAQTSATASAGSALLAKTSETNAGQSASAASNSATAAATDRGSAKTFSDQASASATDAQGSKTSASISSGASASSATAASLSSKATLPDNFVDPANWVNWGNWGGSTSIANGVLRSTNGGSISSTFSFQPVAGETYRLSATHTLLSGSGSVWLGTLTGVAYGHVWWLTGKQQAAVGVTETSSVEISGDQIIANHGPGRVYIGMLAGYSNSGTTDIVRLRIENITSEKASKAAATASAGSASAASVKADEAGQSATAATASLNAAKTAQGSAEAARDQAAQSRTDAAGSASSASGSATLAAGSATTAGQKATAAATSEQNAASSATTAGQQASASEASKTAALTARGQAETFANQASTSKDNAAGSASTASTQAGLAAQSKADATAAASAANTSASTASTKADAAGTSAQAANQSRLDAQAANGGASGSASAASTSAAAASASATSAASSATIATSYSSGSVSINDKFANWQDPAALPNNWGAWERGGNFRWERRAGGIGSPYYVRTLNETSNVNSGFYQAVPVHPGKWVVEVTAAVDQNNSWVGSGVTDGIWRIDFAAEADNNSTFASSSSNGAPRTWSKLVSIPAGQTSMNLHAMHGWDGFGSPRDPKYMNWYMLSFRPATQPEIDAGKALANAAANATRIEQVNSALSTDLGSLATRTQSVEARAGGVEARTGIVETAVASATSKLAAARVELTAISPGGRASMTIRSDTANGAAIDFGANLNIVGNIKVQKTTGGKTIMIDSDTGISFNNGLVMKISGIGFGSSNQFIEWVGPSLSSLAQCTEANAIQYIKTDGSAYFGGSLSAGQLKNSTSSSGTSTQEQASVGPFGSNGGIVKYVASWAYRVDTAATYPATQAGLQQYRTAAAQYNANADGFGVMTVEHPASTVTLSRSIGGQAFEQLNQRSYTTETITFMGTPPVIGDTPGSAQISSSTGGGFTINDPAQGTVGRTVQLVLNRSFSVGSGTVFQRLTIVAVEG